MWVGKLFDRRGSSVRCRAGRSPILLMLICALVALTAGVGAGLLMGRRALAGSRDKKGHARKEVVEPGTVAPLGELVVNLGDTDTLRYAKITVSLGLVEKVSEEKMKEQTPILRDAVISVMTGKQFRDLHRPGGVKALKEEVRQAVQKRLPHATVLEVYFEAFAMQ
jgi:flagellar FliL protein